MLVDLVICIQPLPPGAIIADACSLPAVAGCLITKHLDQTAQKKERNTQQGRKKTMNLTALQMPLYRMQAALLDITTV